MPSFHHGGLAIPKRRKMMRPLFFEPRLHPSIVKFFALIRLHAERPPRRGLLVNAFQPSYHVLAALGSDGGGPGILGQDIDHGQKIFLPLIPSTQFLHVHQIHLPLFVSVKDQGGGDRKTRPSGFVESITQHRLKKPLRLRVFQLVGFGKRVYPTQGPGCMGILVGARQRHDHTDTRSFPFSFFNSFFFTHYMVFLKQDQATKVFLLMAPPLKLPVLGFGHFRKLVQPLFLPLPSLGFC